MMHNKTNNDSAFHLRTMDILKNVLSHAGNATSPAVINTESNGSECPAFSGVQKTFK